MKIAQLLSTFLLLPFTFCCICSSAMGATEAKYLLPGIHFLLQERIQERTRFPHFTVTADMRSYHSAFSSVAMAINRFAGDEGLFHVSPGDFDGTVQHNRDVIDQVFGMDAIWIPGIGNHEAETGEDMEWLRTEYDNGHNLRTPLRVFTNEDGPIGTKRLNYTWDNLNSNTHFIMLNQYWNGGMIEADGLALTGDDTATDGDIVTELYNWLEADLIANQDKAIFVFGHEPAFPENRHIGDSLDKYEGNRDAFWALLEQYNVEAYICGHTHFFSAHQGDKNGIGNVWQIDVGNAGNDPGDGYTFLNVILQNGIVRYNVYRSINSWWYLAQSWSEPANTIYSPPLEYFDIN